MGHLFKRQLASTSCLLTFAEGEIVTIRARTKEAVGTFKEDINKLRSCIDSLRIEARHQHEY
jgi:hypothetical protein